MKSRVELGAKKAHKVFLWERERDEGNKRDRDKEREEIHEKGIIIDQRKEREKEGDTI